MICAIFKEKMFENFPELKKDPHKVQGIQNSINVKNKTTTTKNPTKTRYIQTVSLHLIWTNLVTDCESPFYVCVCVSC